MTWRPTTGHLLVAVWLTLAVAQTARVVVTSSLASGDGIYHFAHLHSIVVDRDLDPINEILYFREQVRSPLTGRPKIGNRTTRNPATGEMINKYPIGLALLALPAYVAVYVGVARAGGGRRARRRQRLRLDLSVRLGTADCGLRRARSVVLSARGDDRRRHGRGRVVGDAAGGRRHAVALLRDAGAVFLACVVGDMCGPGRLAVAAGARRRQSLAVVRDGTRRGRGSRSSLPGCRAAGDSRGRPGVDPVPLTTRDDRTLARPGRGRADRRAAAAGGELSPVRPPVHDGYFGEGFPHWRSPYLLYTLLSEDVGLVRWAPIVALAIVGLVIGARRGWPHARIGLIFVGLQVYMVSSWFFLSQGHTFGNRMLVNCTVFFAAGLAALLTAAARRPQLRFTIQAVGMLLVAVNVLLIWLWSRGAIGPLGRLG